MLKLHFGQYLDENATKCHIDNPSWNDYIKCMEKILKAPKAHPFEASGLGIGPFRFLYCASLPSPSLAAQNPTAYQAALRDLPKDVRLGTCAHCGMALMDNYVIESADKKKFAVGCVCVGKTNDRSLCNPVAIAAAKLQRAKNRARAEVKHKKLMERVEVCKKILETQTTWFTTAPHPNAYYANTKGATYRDYILWCFASAGDKGRLECCKDVERLV